MASRLVENGWSLACPRCARCLPFCRGGLDSSGIRRHMAERQIGQTDGLDVHGFWLYGRHVRAIIYLTLCALCACWCSA
jgi:hypothetical protein